MLKIKGLSTRWVPFYQISSDRRLSIGKVSIVALVLAVLPSLSQPLLQPPKAHAATCGASTNFITTWKTDNPGSSNSTSITIPGASTVYNYQVDWNNDGVMDETVNTPSKTHDFGSAGTHTIQICGAFPRIYFDSGGDKAKILRVDQWGDNQWVSFGSAFSGASNIQVTATDAPDLSAVTDMQFMFRQASSLTGNASFASWDTSNVTDMGAVFYENTVFNAPIGNWDTSNVTDMSAMFEDADAFNQDISGWNTSNVTDMRSVFLGAKDFNQPLNGWDTGNATEMSGMFAGTESFNQPLGSWDTSSVIDMAAMFSGATAFNSTIDPWDTSNVTNTVSMFNDATAFNQPLNNWNIGSVTNLSSMFENATSFNQNLNSWNTGNVTTTSSMFTSATAFNGDIGSWNVSSLLNAFGMFEGASSFNKPIGNWDTSSVGNMNLMFHNASSFNQPIGNWDVSNVVAMVFMFSGVNYEMVDPSVPSVNLISVPMAFNQDLSAWDTGNVTTMLGMFSSDSYATYASALIGAGYTIVHSDTPFTHPFSHSLASWDVSNVATMEGMLSHSSLSSAEYDATLTAWKSQSLQNSVNLGAHGLNYCNGAADRQNIITTHSWTITDGGQNCLTLSPGSSLTGVDLNTGDPLANPDATNHTIRLLKSGVPLVDVTVDFNTAIDWSAVTGATDPVNFKSVVAGLASAPSTVGTHTLYVPKATFQDGVIVCPHALTLAQVTETCSGAIKLSASSPSVSIVNIGAKNYWKITGLTGTGAIGTILNVPGAPNTGVGPAEITQIMPLSLVSFDL